MIPVSPMNKMSTPLPIKAVHPDLRNGPSCLKFQSSIKISINRSEKRLPAISVVTAEVLTVQAYSSGEHHEYLVDLTTTKIQRSRNNNCKFVIQGKSRVLNVFCNDSYEAEAWASILLHSSSRRFKDCYRIGKQIAGGRHSKVYLAHSLDDDNTRYVVKVNSRNAELNSCKDRSQFERNAHLQLLPKETGLRERSADIEERKFQELKHRLSREKIVTLCDSFGTVSQDFLVFKYQNGEILSSVISKHGSLCERDARIVMWDLLSALHFIHAQGVIHRDVCASNVFFWNKKGIIHAKLFDFSEARLIGDEISGEEPFRDSPGDQNYQALEILSGRYHGKSADIWSCGVLLYKVLSGTLPFRGENSFELGKHIIEVECSNSLFAAPVWDSVSSEAISLIKQMLQHDPFKRPSALGARSHAWLNNDNTFRQAHIYKQLCAHERILLKSRLNRNVPQRLQTPVACSPYRPTRGASTSDRDVLPVALTPYEEGGKDSQNEDSTEEQGGDLPDAQDEDSKNPSAAKRTEAGDASDSDRFRRTRSGFCQNLRGSALEIYGSLLMDKLNLQYLKPFVSNAFRKLETLETSVQNLTIRLRNSFRREGESLSYEDSQLGIPYQFSDFLKTIQRDRAETVDERKRQKEINERAKKYPDKHSEHLYNERQSLETAGGLGLTHQCNSSCSFRKCTRSTLVTRADRILQMKSETKLKSTVKSNLEVGPTTAPDRAKCKREQQRAGSSTDVVPTTVCLDEDVYSWAKQSKLFSDMTLKPAPVDPMFFNSGYPCGDETHRVTDGKMIKEQETLQRTSSRWEKCNKPIPVLLRDEMCVGTHFMKSVVTAAHVGLSEFSRSKPRVAEILLSSPTAQLQLSMILPYRRKFRITALAIKAMFRMVSLKKGSCLTRRVWRGQSLSVETIEALSKIRWKYRKQPLKAKMPVDAPPDSFTNGLESVKKRVKPRPQLDPSSQTFWERKIEVQKGVVKSILQFVLRAFLKMKSFSRL